jgi:hypothetical protein
VPGSGCDHRCRHLRSWPERVRGEWVESFRRRVDGGYERFGGGFDRHARGVADVRAHGYTRVIPRASDLADTHAFRGH